MSLIVTLRMFLFLRPRTLQRVVFAALIALRIRGALRLQQDTARGEEKEEEKKRTADRGKHCELPPGSQKGLTRLP
jgi:hypothetical protein